MPLYDRVCADGCGWRAVDVWEPIQTADPACPVCAAPSARAWLTTATAVIGDEIDLVQTNGTKTPIRFRSRQARQRWLKAHGLKVYDAHVGSLGSDKSTETTNWAAGYDPYTAANVKLLLERAFHQTPREAAPLNMHITTTVKDLTKEEAARYGR